VHGPVRSTRARGNAIGVQAPAAPGAARASPWAGGRGRPWSGRVTGSAVSCWRGGRGRGMWACLRCSASALGAAQAAVRAPALARVPEGATVAAAAGVPAAVSAAPAMVWAAAAAAAAALAAVAVSRSAAVPLVRAAPVPAVPASAGWDRRILHGWALRERGRNLLAPGYDSPPGAGYPRGRVPGRRRARGSGSVRFRARRLPVPRRERVICVRHAHGRHGRPTSDSAMSARQRNARRGSSAARQANSVPSAEVRLRGRRCPDSRARGLTRRRRGGTRSRRYAGVVVALAAALIGGARVVLVQPFDTY